MYVELKNINKTYGSYQASRNVNFGIEKGKLIGLLGPSGSGKTTILRMIAGLENPDSGEIIIDGKVVNDVPASERGIGFVFQNYALFRYMTVYDNVAFGLKVQKVDKKKIHARVMELVKLVGLEGLEKRYPSQLSGGQRQRVAFARALAPNPQVLLLDEPFAAIDAKIRQELRSWLKEMIEKLGITSIFVTHDQDEAIEVADEIIITNAGQIEQKGTPVEVYRNPETAFTASFFGQPSVLENADDFHTFTQAERADKIIVRPEFVKISKLDEVEKFRTSVSQGVVERVSFRGDNLELQVRVNNSVVTARRSLEKADVREGEIVNVFLYRIFALKGDSVQLIENEAVRDDFVII
ncbi:sulfate/molybdate ABC transporter ATP-binding protein [Blautia sp. HCP3S3_C4]|uniref:sulfate/molybdate ABC transporter ATP-binding protein n=1 Tax=Blautia sp. HCP3S3_C4 TaxID=3438911 RepID=UPI003F891C2B